MTEENTLPTEVKEKPVKKKKLNRMSKAKLIAALPRTAGILSIVAQKCGCSRQAVYTFVNKNNLHYLVQEEKDKLVDKAESQLANRVYKNDWKAVDKVLSTLGRNRGYVERREVDHGQVENTTVVFQGVNDYPDIKPRDTIDVENLNEKDSEEKKDG